MPFSRTLTVSGTPRPSPRTSGSPRPHLEAFPLDAVLRLRDGGHELLDVRESQSFADGFIPGAIHLPSGGLLAYWVSVLVPRTRPLIVIAEDEATREVTDALASLADFTLAGHLAGGMAPVRDIPGGLAYLHSISPAQLGEHIGEDLTFRIVDVRSVIEFDRGHIEESLNLPLEELPGRIGELPDGEIVVLCQGGSRAFTACSILHRHGRRDLRFLEGGYLGWIRDMVG